MNRIELLFKQKKSKVLSIYFTAGYPRLNDTDSILNTLMDCDVDMIEVGIPFSDPMADGETIQRSSVQALENGMNLDLLFRQLKGFQNVRNVPVLLMGYLNPILQFGVIRFLNAAVEAGVDGVIIPDLPLDVYVKEFKDAFEESGIRMIFLITPETSEARIRSIDEETGGFLYMVTTAGTTGAGSSFGDQHIRYFRALREMGLRNPLLAGFGIGDKAAFDTACAHVSGAIIGSAFIHAISTPALEKGSIIQFIQSIRS